MVFRYLSVAFMLGRGAGEGRRFRRRKGFSNRLFTSSGIGSSMMFWATSWRVDSGISESNWLRYLPMVSDNIRLRNQISKWKIQGDGRAIDTFRLWVPILRASSSRMSLAWILLARFSLLASKRETRLAPQDGHNWYFDWVPTPHLRHGFGSELGGVSTKLGVVCTSQRGSSSPTALGCLR